MGAVIIPRKQEIESSSSDANTNQYSSSSSSSGSYTNYDRSSSYSNYDFYNIKGDNSNTESKYESDSSPLEFSGVEPLEDQISAIE